MFASFQLDVFRLCCEKLNGRACFKSSVCLELFNFPIRSNKAGQTWLDINKLTKRFRISDKYLILVSPSHSTAIVCLAFYLFVAFAFTQSRLLVLGKLDYISSRHLSILFFWHAFCFQTKSYDTFPNVDFGPIMDDELFSFS